MGPPGRTRTRARTARKTRRKTGQLKKSSVRSKNEEATPNSPTKTSSMSSNDDLPKTEGIEFEAVDDDVVSTSGCSTPKGQRFRIPEIVTCPPAPKKRRLISNCSLQRSPIAFFAPPDLELFFYYFALRGISV